MQQFAKRGLLKIADDRDSSIEQLVEDWQRDFRKGLDARIFAGTRLETAAVNRMCQQSLLDAGQLQTESIAVGKYNLHVGDQIVVTRNNSALMVKIGTQGTVVGIDQQSGEIQLRIDRGLTVRINIEAFPHVTGHYRLWSDTPR